MGWTLDKTHAQVGFTARHMMVSKVHGVFKDFDATIEIDEEAPERSYVEASIAAASVDTKMPDRDAHLRSPDFFDAEQHPYIRFRSRSVSRPSEGQLEVVGDLTIRDVTREVHLKGDYEGPVSDPWGGKRIGVSLSGDVDREAFGLVWNMVTEAGGFLVGKNIKLSIDAELVQTPGESEENAAKDAVTAG